MASKTAKRIGEFEDVGPGECHTCGGYAAERIEGCGEPQCLDCYADALGHGGDFESAGEAVDAFEQATGRDATGRQCSLVNSYFRRAS